MEKRKSDLFYNIFQYDFQFEKGLLMFMMMRDVLSKKI